SPSPPHLSWAHSSRLGVRSKGGERRGGEERGGEGRGWEKSFPVSARDFFPSFVTLVFLRKKYEVNDRFLSLSLSLSASLSLSPPLLLSLLLSLLLLSLSLSLLLSL